MNFVDSADVTVLRQVPGHCLGPSDAPSQAGDSIAAHVALDKVEVVHPRWQTAKILQLDPNYPDLILVKRLSKALDEIAKNEELMEGILAAAADNDGGMDGHQQPAPIDEEDEEDGGNGHTGRLKTIGEEEDQKGLGTQPTVKQLHEEQEENEDEYDENPNNNDDEDDGDEYI